MEMPEYDVSIFDEESAFFEKNRAVWNIVQCCPFAEDHDISRFDFRGVGIAAHGEGEEVAEGAGGDGLR